MSVNDYNIDLLLKSSEGTCVSNALFGILANHSLFGTLPERALKELASQFAIKKYAPNQYIFHQDDIAERLYVILDGEISVETHSVDGKVTNIAQLKPGEIFGEFALIDSAGRSASARVSKKSNLASLPGSVFRNLIHSQPKFTIKLLEMVVGRLRNSNAQVESLVTLTVMQRTARLLLLISDTDGEDLKITQKEIGERLYASREKVNVKLKELEQAGAIETGHGRITVKDRKLLNRIMEIDE